MPKDEEYEKGCVKGNMVYKIHWTDPPTLMPVEGMCGHIPQVSVLDTKEVISYLLITFYSRGRGGLSVCQTLYLCLVHKKLALIYIVSHHSGEIIAGAH